MSQEPQANDAIPVATTSRRRLIVGLIKMLIALSLLGYLLTRAWQNEQFQILTTGQVRWERFALACLLTLTAIMITFERWYWLTLEVGAPMQRAQAYRLGFIGYLLNFVTVGTVGGDAFRAIAVAAQDRSRASSAVATVIYDRVVGLVALFALATFALYALDLSQVTAGDPLRLGFLQACRALATVAAAVGGVSLILLAWLPKTLAQTLVTRLTGLPLVGKGAGPIAMAMLAFAGHRRVMLATFLASVPVHLINALAVVAVASALPIERPSIMAHLATVPLAHLAGVLPLPGGIGAFEGALSWLYEAAAETEEAGRYGLLVAFGVRLTMLLVAALGIVVYLSSRSKQAAAVAATSDQA